MEWNIEPPLWEEDADKTFSFTQKGIELTVGQKVIKAVGENVSDFYIKAIGIVEMIAAIFTLNRSEAIKISEKKGGIMCVGSGRFIYSFSDSENLIRRNSELLNYSEDTTLRGAVGYYNHASSGSDQLTIAGNLYMAMEELKVRFGGWNEVADALQPFNSKLTRTHIKRKTGKRLNEGRHAYVNGQKAAPLSEVELNQQKQSVRDYILAYVEWLKANK
jgi:hypothetical protein